MQAKVETSLKRALESTAGSDDLLDVVLNFDSAAASVAPSGSAPTSFVQRRELRAAAMSKTIEQALTRAGDITGTQPTRVTPFPMIGSAFVRAPRSYFRALLDQNEVAGAMFNSGSSPP